MISGAIQKGVPITVLRLERVVSSLAETPKSASFAFPSRVNKTLPALISYIVNNLTTRRETNNLLCEFSYSHGDRRFQAEWRPTNIESRLP